MAFHDLKTYAFERNAVRLNTIYGKTDSLFLKAFLRISHPLKTSKAFCNFYSKKEKTDPSRA
ncbi:Uncharacterised protein [uncultured archaeon]|nr:Uncharacterised protein [uncultured archaeon]